MPVRRNGASGDEDEDIEDGTDEANHEEVKKEIVNAMDVVMTEPSGGCHADAK